MVGGLVPKYADLVHELGGKTIFPVSTTPQVEGGYQLLEEGGSDDDGKIAQIATKGKIKGRYPFERQPMPLDEPWPRPEEGWEYVQT